MLSKPIIKIPLFIIALLLVIYLILFLQPRTHYIEDNPFMAGEDNPPHIIAHAGGNMEFPDNTLEAFYNAYSVDENVIMEMDVAMTSDNVIVLTHDITFDRKTNLIEADVHETAYQDLVNDEVDFGYDNPIPNDAYNTDQIFERYTNFEGTEVTPLDVEYPEGVEARHEEKFLVTTLEEVIKAFPETYMIVELKQFGDIGAEALDVLMDLLEDLDEDYNTFERISLASFHRDIFDLYMELRSEDYPQLMFSPQEDSIRTFYTMHLFGVSGLFRDPVSSFQVPTGQGNIDLTTDRFVRTVQSHNIALHYWTINDEETMRKLIEIGADGIITDRPTLMRSLIEEYYPEHYE